MEGANTVCHVMMELILQQMEVNPAWCVLQVRNVLAKQTNQLHVAQGIIGKRHGDQTKFTLLFGRSCSLKRQSLAHSN